MLPRTANIPRPPELNYIVVARSYKHLAALRPVTKPPDYPDSGPQASLVQIMKPSRVARL